MASLAIVAAPAVAEAQPAGDGGVAGAQQADGPDDFLTPCDPPGPPGAGPAAMDIAGASAVSAGTGVDVKIETRGDIAAFFDSNPASAAFVAHVMTTDGRVYDAIHELHEGKRRDVVEVGGQPSPANVDADVSGDTITLRVRGLPSPLDGATWSITTYVKPDPLRVLCDLLMPEQTGVLREQGTLPTNMPIGSGTGLGPVGTPPNVDVNPYPDGRAAPSTSTVKVFTPQMPAAQQPTDPDGGSGILWWILGMLAVVFAGFGLWIGWIRAYLRTRRLPPDAGGHGARPTPPPDSNDFGH